MKCNNSIAMIIIIIIRIKLLFYFFFLQTKRDLYRVEGSNYDDNNPTYDYCPFFIMIKFVASAESYHIHSSSVLAWWTFYPVPDFLTKVRLLTIILHTHTYTYIVTAWIEWVFVFGLITDLILSHQIRLDRGQFLWYPVKNNSPNMF